MEVLPSTERKLNTNRAENIECRIVCGISRGAGEGTPQLSATRPLQHISGAISVLAIGLGKGAFD